MTAARMRSATTTRLPFSQPQDASSCSIAMGHVCTNINGATIVLGGTAWGQYLPKSFDDSIYRKRTTPIFTFWVSHHDIRFPGYDDAGRFDCREIPGIDAIINGHIHRTLPEVKSGQTTWINPGNISRVSRSDTTREHKPRVLRFDVSQTGGHRDTSMCLISRLTMCFIRLSRAKRLSWAIPCS